MVGPVCANIIRKIELRLEMLDINVLGYNDVPEKVEWKYVTSPTTFYVGYGGTINHEFIISPLNSWLDILENLGIRCNFGDQWNVQNMFDMKGT